MANALPLGPGTRIFSGARAIFAFNGEVIGFATGVSGSEDIGMEEGAVIGRLDVVEHIPVSYRVTLSCSVFRTISRKQSPTSGSSPGSLKEQRIFPRFDEILKVEGVDCAIYDELSKKAIYLYQGVKCASHSFNIGARAVTMENVTFVALKLKDEGDPETNVLTVPNVG